MTIQSKFKQEVGSRGWQYEFYFEYIFCGIIMISVKLMTENYLSFPFHCLVVIAFHRTTNTNIVLKNLSHLKEFSSGLRLLKEV